MNEILTPERVMEIGQEWKRIFLNGLVNAALDAATWAEFMAALPIPTT